MEKLPPAMSPEHWLRQVFSCKAARDGAIVRRKVTDVHRIVGRAAFEAELHRRGYQAVENSGQYVIFCNRSPIRPVGAQISSKKFAKSLPRLFRKVSENFSPRP